MRTFNTYNPAAQGIMAGKAEARLRANHEQIATILENGGFSVRVTLEGVVVSLNRSVLISEVWLPISGIEGYDTPKRLLRRSDSEILVR